jgi:hypothetical protein
MGVPKKMNSRNPSSRLMQLLFRSVLVALGMGLQLAFRWSGRFRSQLAHPRTVQVGSADGVFHHYRFAPRGVTSQAGRLDNPDVGICFDNALLGLITLASPHAVGRIVHALLDRAAEYEGNAVLVLWFFGLTRFVLPLGRTAPLHAPLPEAYTAHNPHGRVASRIVREPVVDVLDPNWTAAHRRHAQMIIPRGAAGDAVKLW